MFFEGKHAWPFIVSMPQCERSGLRIYRCCRLPFRRSPFAP
jgi:hypothetical protein